MSSAKSGYLTPSTEVVEPVEGNSLDDLLQEAIKGITGLPAENVRPRWQPFPPKEPADLSVDWCAFGVISEEAEGNVAVIHHPTGAIGDADAGPLQGGWDELQRHQIVSVMASFYGANSRKFANRLRDGLYVSQNREMLRGNGLGLIDVGELRTIPDIVGDSWRMHADLQFRLYRYTNRAYPVRNINRASGVITSDVPETDVAWDTNNVNEE
jgi:hypothetical protein